MDTSHSVVIYRNQPNNKHDQHLYFQKYSTTNIQFKNDLELDLDHFNSEYTYPCIRTTRYCCGLSSFFVVCLVCCALSRRGNTMVVYSNRYATVQQTTNNGRYVFTLNLLLLYALYAMYAPRLRREYRKQRSRGACVQ